MYNNSTAIPQIGDRVIRIRESSDLQKGGTYYVVETRQGDSEIGVALKPGERRIGWYNAGYFNLDAPAGSKPAKPIDPVKQAEKDAAELVATAEAAAADLVAKAKKEAAEKAEKDRIAAEKKAVADRLTHEKALAAATGILLSDIEYIFAGAAASNREEYAKFRTELQPLAASYGVKIVLVGDKTKGTLVVA